MKKIAFFISVIFLIIFSIMAINIGVVHIPIDVIIEIIKAKILNYSIPEKWSLYAITIWNLRLPRICMSIVAGSALAISGATFQSIFRNPICDPYILGISSGASLGAAIAFILGLDAYIFGLTGAALFTATLTLLLVMGIAAASRKKSMETILLTGIAINFLVSSMVTLLMVLHQEALDKIIFWTMGSFASSSWQEVGILFIILIIVSVFLFFYSKSLNIMQLGEDIARTSGIKTQKVRLIVLSLSSLLIAVTVAFCGVVGFVGLIIPHIARLMFGNDNRINFTFSILFGAIFCVLADTFSKFLAAPAELPVGSITAMIGAPYFIFLLLFSRSRSTF